MGVNDELVPLAAHLAEPESELQAARAAGNDDRAEALSFVAHEARTMMGAGPGKALVRQGQAGLSFFGLYVLLPLTGLLAAWWARRRHVRD